MGEKDDIQNARIMEESLDDLRRTEKAAERLEMTAESRLMKQENKE